MIIEGCFEELNGWRVWIYGGHKMTKNERIHEAKEIAKSGYLKIDNQLRRVTNEKINKDT